MNQCDCNERIGIEINSFQLYEQLRKFFEYQVQEDVFCDIPVELPYFCGYDLKPEEKIIYDIDYIKQRSLWLDLKIIFKTFGVVFFHSGAK